MKTETFDEKRERILKTAIQLFGRDGYYGTRMSEVARKARVSPKTLYKFFSGKKELFISARQYAYNRLVRDTIATVPPELVGLDSFTTVKSVLKSYSAFIRQNRGLARILAEAIAVVDDDIRRDQEESFVRAVSAMTSVFKKDVQQGKVKLEADPDKVAWLFLSLAFLIAYAVLLDLDRESIGGFEPEYALEHFFEAMGEPVYA
jgi:TetR/AcrR family transcriptional regulator, fatty acid metabolism regulator protein